MSALQPACSNSEAATSSNGNAKVTKRRAVIAALDEGKCAIHFPDQKEIHLHKENFPEFYRTNFKSRSTPNNLWDDLKRKKPDGKMTLKKKNLLWRIYTYTDGYVPADLNLYLKSDEGVLYKNRSATKREEGQPNQRMVTELESDEGVLSRKRSATKREEGQPNQRMITELESDEGVLSRKRSATKEEGQPNQRMVTELEKDGQINKNGPRLQGEGGLPSQLEISIESQELDQQECNTTMKVVEQTTPKGIQYSDEGRYNENTQEETLFGLSPTSPAEGIQYSDEGRYNENTQEETLFGSSLTFLAEGIQYSDESRYNENTQEETLFSSSPTSLAEGIPHYRSWTFNNSNNQINKSGPLLQGEGGHPFQMTTPEDIQYSDEVTCNALFN